MTNDYLNLMAQLQASIDEVRSMMPVGDDQTTSVEYSPGGAIITAIDNSPPESEGGGDTYDGQFKVTDGEEEDTVDISAGKVVSGTATTSVPEEVGLNVENKLYIALEVKYSGGWTAEYAASISYPTQAKDGSTFVWRVLIASRADADSAWDRQVCGQLNNPRAVPS